MPLLYIAVANMHRCRRLEHHDFGENRQIHEHDGISFHAHDILSGTRGQRD
jgi:hypothetical protein